MLRDQINILLVDDEQGNLNALEAVLDDPGYRLLRADNADAALRLLLENDVAAIVLDIKMPGISGFELAQLIKGTKRFHQIPIVFLTAYMIDDQDIVAGYSAGAVDYLTKPVNPQILRHKIAVFAELFRKTRALAELNDSLETRVAERTAELAEAAKQKDAFLATLAHELRNPLAPLRTGLDLLLQMGAEGVALKTLNMMNRQLDHMVRLIDDLLDVSRISRGMLELKRERTELGTLIENVIDAARPYVDKRQQTLSVTVPRGLFATVDATRIAQIVGNLLSNASKFTAQGGQLWIELRHGNGDAEIRIADSGAGIPADQIDRVFEMFARIDRSVPYSTGGLGIGLALSRQLAALHGGELTAASEGEERGSVFTLRVPDVEFYDAPASVSAPQHQRIGMRKLRIVVIEDNEDASDTLAMWLEDQGHSVSVARTGPDGLVMVQEVRPDVVLCDVGLPGMDGIEICKQVKATTSTTHPIMIALTGWGMESDRRRTGNAGFDHHIVKPFMPDKLRSILETIR